jgi:GNAT superfamily N-acetyltransferase
MVKLGKAQYAAVFDLYRAQSAFFPLIGAVLQKRQDGVVYANVAGQPRQFYVEHTFGFAQVFGVPDGAFEDGLWRHLMVDKRFAAAKVRLYAPYCPIFLAGKESGALKSQRQRYVPGKTVHTPPEDSAHLSCVEISESNFDGMESAFGIASRFWRTREDFIAGALGCLVLIEGKPAALCYAAAVADDRAEIDVFTLPAYRQKGAGRLAVSHFITRCAAHSVQPLWDCFTNNAGSVNLCLSAGFVPGGPPYPFFTISK